MLLDTLTPNTFEDIDTSLVLQYRERDKHGDYEREKGDQCGKKSNKDLVR